MFISGKAVWFSIQKKGKSTESDTRVTYLQANFRLLSWLKATSPVDSTRRLSRYISRMIHSIFFCSRNCRAEWWSVVHDC